MRTIEVSGIARTDQGQPSPLTDKRMHYGHAWEAEVRERGDFGRVRLRGTESGALFSVDKQSTTKHYRVLYKLDNLAPGERQILVSYAGRADRGGLLEWVAVLTETPADGRQFLLRERPSTQHLQATERRGSIEGALPTDSREQLFVGFQFTTEPGQFWLSQLSIQVRSESERWSVPPPAVREWLPPTLFDAAWYQSQLPSPLNGGDNALQHYLREGEARGFSPHPLFDPIWYKSQLKTELGESESALDHFLRVGAAAGLSPHPLIAPQPTSIHLSEST